MRHNHSSKLSFKGGLDSAKILLGLVLAILLLAFFSQRFINFDFIGWTSGFTHPLTGWDHLITMLAVGIWAAQLRGHAIWMLPLAFVSVMSLGGLAGAAGLSLPSVEGLILVSCGFFSILIIRKVRFSTQVNVMIVSFFAFFHGFAHGQEISASASLISYTLGFMLATLLLHSAGIIVAKLVILIVTCLISILFSNLAQANHGEFVAANDSLKLSHIENSKNTLIYPFLAKAHQRNSAAANRPVFKQQERHGNISRYGLEASSYARPAPPGNKFQCNKVKASSNKLDNTSFSESNSFTSSKPLVFAASEYLQTVHQFCVVNNRCGTHLDFKHYYPDINHTPGRDYLSNGVGLTSPPTECIDFIVQQNSQLFRTSSVLSFEASCLQIAPATNTALNITFKRANLAHQLFHAFQYLCDAKQVVSASELNLIGNSLAYILSKPYFQPFASGIGTISHLDLLPVCIKPSREDEKLHVLPFLQQNHS